MDHHTQSHLHSHLPINNQRFLVDANQSRQNILSQENQHQHDNIILNMHDMNEQHQQQPQDVLERQDDIFKIILNSLQTNIPIFLILLAKTFHQHLTGFFIFLAFIVTLQWSNKTIIKQIELKERKNNLLLIFLILFLIINITLYFYAFHEFSIQYWYVKILNPIF